MNELSDSTVSNSEVINTAIQSESKRKNKHTHTNHKKRSFDELDTNDNDSPQPSKRRKLNKHLQNICHATKRFKEEIRSLKQERDKYKKERDYYRKKMTIYKSVYLQMLAIVNPSQKSNNHNSSNATQMDIDTSNIEMESDSINIESNDISNDTNADSVSNVQKRASFIDLTDDKFDKETEPPIIQNNSANPIIVSHTPYFCKYCAIYFRNARLLSDHNNDKHSKTNEENTNNKKVSWEECHFISIDCKFCGEYFDNFNEYLSHLQAEFDKHPTKTWRYCNEPGCDPQKLWGTAGYIAHLGVHGYKQPFHCNIKSGNELCQRCTTTKSNMTAHLRKIHKIDV